MKIHNTVLFLESSVYAGIVGHAKAHNLRTGDRKSAEAIMLQWIRDRYYNDPTVQADANEQYKQYKASLDIPEIQAKIKG